MDVDRADVGSFPQFAMGPKSRRKKVESSVVAGDLIGAKKQAVLIPDDELAGFVALAGELADDPAGGGEVEVDVGVGVEKVL